MPLANRFGRGMPHHDFVGGPGFHSWGLLIGLAALVALVALVIVAMRRGSLAPAAPLPPSDGADAALREARMRYVHGEITREQYREIAADLGAERPPPGTAS